jgi:hypothetical protein
MRWLTYEIRMGEKRSAYRIMIRKSGIFGGNMAVNGKIIFVPPFKGVHRRGMDW